MSVALCQNLHLASQSQTAASLYFPIKAYAALTTRTAGATLLVWFSLKHGTKLCVFGISRVFMRAHGICSFLELTVCGATLKTWIKSKREKPGK